MLMNQYNKILQFDVVDETVLNKGINFSTSGNTDQEVAALDYTQQIRHINASDDADCVSALTDEI